MRLLTYNIHKGIGGRDRRYDLERVIAVIESQEPDFVCLQEVDRHVPRSDHHDQPYLLAERLKMAGRLFQFNVSVRGGGYGNLLLARWPLLHTHQFSLRRGRRKPRGGQVAVVETPQGRVCVVNTHLGLAGRHDIVGEADMLALPHARAEIGVQRAGRSNGGDVGGGVRRNRELVDSRVPDIVRGQHGAGADRRRLTHCRQRGEKGPCKIANWSTHG